jgi:FKBP-type peptidyl-prolyl cis-trans isomerase FklB
MKSLFPILSLATAFGLVACDSKSDSASNASAPDSASGTPAAGGSDAEGSGAAAGKPTKASGLKYTVLKKGTGKVNPKATDKVTVHYHGTLLNGTVFDSSVERNEPATLPLNGVIPGWTEGVQLMVVGDKFKLEIPANLAYGARSPSALIPPNSTLVFEVELLEIK